MVVNTAKLTSDDVMDKLRKELETKLKGWGITAETEVFNPEWSLARPNNRGMRGGVKHRDVYFKRPGYLTVLLFFGDRKSKGFGTVKIWRNSQKFLEEHAYIDSDKDEFKHHMRKLNKLDKMSEGGGRGLLFSPGKYNCAIFDSRLWHQSLAHTSLAHRVCLTLFLKIKEGRLANPPKPDTSYSYYMEDHEWEVVDLRNFI